MDCTNDKDWIWWKHGVIYHIYPLSFYDSNNDGFGDIRGIIEKLDYISGLSVDAIWLSPIFESPMIDYGYDVTSYRVIDPVFGSMDDFKMLLQEAHRRGIRVILDMIMNHTSDRHPWFLESRSSLDNPKRDWYIWRQPDKNKKPNNWKSAYGGSAWQLDELTGQYYLHTFFKEQPDLNWRNKELREIFMDEFKFWLELGVDGFRLDVINMIVKDKKFRNNPGLIMGLIGHRKWYTRNQPKSYKIVRQLRKLVDSYGDRVLVGEVYTLPPGDAELAGSYLHGLHLAFDFSLMFKPWNAGKYYNAIRNWYASIPADGWPCNVFSNHDLRRSISRIGSGRDKYKKAKIMAMLLLTLKGTPFIYYGEEIGMQNTLVRRRQLRDTLGKKFWPIYKGRDKARTPMQWNTNLFSGFSKVMPWLPVNKDYIKTNVNLLQNDPDSLLEFYVSLIRLRKENKALYAGRWIPFIQGKQGVLVYFRIFEDKKFIIVLNFSRKQKKVSLGINSTNRVLISTHKKKDEFIESSNMLVDGLEATLMEDLNIEQNNYA